MMNSELLKEAIEDAKEMHLHDNPPESWESESIADTDIEEIIEELEEESDYVAKAKKSSFIQNLITSFYRQKPNMMVLRFQKLAGITKVNPAARLTIGKDTFDLTEIPPWYNILRYTLCGFKFEIPSKC